MIPVALKPGVKVTGLSAQCVMAMMIAWQIWHVRGASMFVITSVNDSVHSAKSRHWRGDAFDLRTRNFPGGSLGEAARAASEDLAETLGPDFDVILERDHVHVEYEPRATA